METSTPVATPKRIWLQHVGNPNDTFDWTWCADQINDEDVEYVRADAHVALEKAAREALDSLDAAADLIHDIEGVAVPGYISRSESALRAALDAIGPETGGGE